MGSKRFQLELTQAGRNKLRKPCPIFSALLDGILDGFDISHAAIVLFLYSDGHLHMWHYDGFGGPGRIVWAQGRVNVLPGHTHQACPPTAECPKSHLVNPPMRRHVAFSLGHSGAATSSAHNIFASSGGLYVFDRIAAGCDSLRASHVSSTRFH